MKTLYIIRHAKSSWEIDGLHDLERPLNERGKKDAGKMGSMLSKKRILPDLVMSSPALRAISTCRIICDAIGFDKNKIIVSRELYFGHVKEIVTLLQQTPNAMNSLMIFGHNPVFSELAHYFTIDFRQEFSTCAIAAISFDEISWALIEKEKGRLQFFEYPKLYR